MAVSILIHKIESIATGLKVWVLSLLPFVFVKLLLVPVHPALSHRISETNMPDEGNKYVKLISAEGHEFYVERNVAMAGSGTIRNMLEGQFKESNENVVRFPDISGYILERVVRYMYYKAQHSQSTTRIPEFVIEPEIALELVIAARYLDC